MSLEICWNVAPLCHFFFSSSFTAVHDVYSFLFFFFPPVFIYVLDGLFFFSYSTAADVLPLWNLFGGSCCPNSVQYCWASFLLVSIHCCPSFAIHAHFFSSTVYCPNFFSLVLSSRFSFFSPFVNSFLDFFLTRFFFFFLSFLSPNCLFLLI